MFDKPHTINLLKGVYAELKEGNFDKSIEVLNLQIKVDNLVNMYIHQSQQGEPPFDELDNEIIHLLIVILQEIYNNGERIESPITDENYDILYEINRKVNGEEIVGASAMKGTRTISQHSYPDLRGTLDKIHFVTREERGKDARRSLEDWVKSVETKLGRKLYTNEAFVLLTIKIDGVSAIFEMGKGHVAEKVLKRGDTTLNEAEEIDILKGIKLEFPYMDIPDDVEYGLKTEIVMDRPSFERFCEKYGEFKSPRSAVSSILNSLDKDKELLTYLKIIPLQVQYKETQEIEIAPYLYKALPSAEGPLNNYELFAEKVSIMQEAMRDVFEIDADGVVVHIRDKNVQKKLGRKDGKINNFEVAYKFKPEQKKTILKTVEMSAGILGNITPVAKIEPVKMKGNTISSISLGSMDRFASLQLNEGDEVLIKYDVIPYLDIDETCKKGTGERFEVPTHCSYCHEKLEKEPVLRCVNNNCSSRMIGKIINFTNKMAIPNISIGTITTLFKEGFLTNIEDLYRLKNHKRSITMLNGFGEKSFNKIIEGIDSRREVFDYDFIGSIGIPTIGRKVFKKVIDVFPLDKLLELCEKGNVEPFVEIQGISHKTAAKIIFGVQMNRELIEFLQKELKIKRDNRTYTIKVAFTKVRDKDFEEFLDTKNVLVMDKYSKQVDMLIIKDKNTTSSKVEKAIKDGKEVVAIDDAYKLFGYQI